MQKEKEDWKDVPNYEGLYQVSDKGKVKNLRNNSLMTPQKHSYIRVCLSKGGVRKQFRVHQLVAMAFLGHIPCGQKLVVNHINLDKHDNRLSNLELISARDNGNMKHLPSSSKYTGVHWCNTNSIWRAAITIDGKSVNLGRFTNEEKASEQYELAKAAVENGVFDDSFRKVRKKTSKYKGVSWSEREGKWIAQGYTNKKTCRIGGFKNEEDANIAYIEYNRDSGESEYIDD